MEVIDKPSPQYGEIWWVVLEPVQGSEQGGRRPVLVISNDWFNSYNPSLVLGVPITRVNKQIRLQVPITAGEGGLVADSVIMCEQIRSMDRTRFRQKIGSASPEIMTAVRESITAIISLGLPKF
ncbi:MAG: type II toxin-antitoxin system PemK/MazF family toxin [Thermomicrobiales bacterium]|nr:type II toxin-antitoxin system PemK/MazF family toxin [Thermomicrobiales bacterium]MCO5225716.1 type II toxin-antitoxin system PemK/MazF family toxin [Thermomicrobiales bacterium]MCO5227933.1 type II toxin-antitoxin system PemK/MazF family toxin [Thermomicrobiales bacterium]